MIIGTNYGFIRGQRLATLSELNGKANSTHTHSASQITSGILPVSRGGTGVSDLSELGSIVGQPIFTTTFAYEVNSFIVEAFDLPQECSRVEIQDPTDASKIIIVGRSTYYSASNPPVNGHVSGWTTVYGTGYTALLVILSSDGDILWGTNGYAQQPATVTIIGYG